MRPPRGLAIRAGGIRLLIVAASSNVLIRTANADDDEILRTIDLATWSTSVSPAGPPSLATSFFDSTRADEVLVAVLDGAVVGYATLGRWYDIAASAHVLELKGLAVLPDHQRHGIGRRLVDAAIAAARRRQARRLALRVLGPNAAARTLYESCGFQIEGIFREQFLLDGRYVDDVFMAVDLGC